MGMEAPKATLPARPALVSAADGKRFGFSDFWIQEVRRKICQILSLQFYVMLRRSGTTVGSANSGIHNPSHAKR
ncbi:hypothetical protein [Rhizobium sp. SYY.PMSO]|uniref:hypothetical protein n=1 Tax=Rhizobium sp. SYY.PMSO TaxID=3382192 RepID=UPI0039902198